MPTPSFWGSLTVESILLLSKVNSSARAIRSLTLREFWRKSKESALLAILITGIISPLYLRINARSALLKSSPHATNTTAQSRKTKILLTFINNFRQIYAIKPLLKEIKPIYRAKNFVLPLSYVIFA
jgi:hypothetical protein